MDIDEDEENISGQFGNDLYYLDLSSTTFRLVEVVKKAGKSSKAGDGSQEVEMAEDAPVAAPTTVTTDGIFTVTVGGSSSNTSNEGKIASLFDKLKPKPGPHPRMNTGMAICKGTLYLYGGIYEEDKKQSTLGDFYALDLHKLDEWKVLISDTSRSHEWIDSGSEGSDSSGSENSDSSDDSSDSEMDTD